MCMIFAGTRDYASSLSENFKVGKTVSPYYLFSLTNILFSLNSICPLPSWAVISFSKPNPQVPLCASSCFSAKKKVVHALNVMFTLSLMVSKAQGLTCVLPGKAPSCCKNDQESS